MLSRLIGIVQKELGQQIENGDLILFFHRRRDRLKVRPPGRKKPRAARQIAPRMGLMDNGA